MARLAFVLIDGCLLANNELTRQLIRAEGESRTVIENCTIARNVVASTSVFNIAYDLELRKTIIDQPGKLTVEFFGAGNDLDVSNVLASDITTLPVSPSIIAGDPSFIDATNGNFRLRQISPAVDFAEPVAGDDRDLDDLPRDQDLPGAPNRFGERDLGAYERQPGAPDCGFADAIFCSSFEL